LENALYMRIPTRQSCKTVFLFSLTKRRIYRV